MATRRQFRAPSLTVFVSMAANNALLNLRQGDGGPRCIWCLVEFSSVILQRKPRSWQCKRCDMFIMEEHAETLADRGAREKLMQYLQDDPPAQQKWTADVAAQDTNYTPVVKRSKNNNPLNRMDLDFVGEAGRWGGGEVVVGRGVKWAA